MLSAMKDTEGMTAAGGEDTTSEGSEEVCLKVTFGG